MPIHPNRGRWTVEYATGDTQKESSPARITTEGNDLKQQTVPHNYAVYVVNTQVKAIQNDASMILASV